MNDLNSVLIEGEVTDGPVGDITFADDMACEFTIMAKGSVRGPIVESISFFDVFVEDRLAQVCAETLSKGSKLRVVGKLKQVRTHSQSRVVIVAEHVEIKPDHKGKGGK